MDIRKKIEENERKIFIPEAAFSDKCRGREKEEVGDEIRTCFMVDRDRIIHSKSFRRLKHKTQVYIKTFGDHYRTRLTHTLEVNQIARTIGASLSLNVDLIEAISLGHDIGHVAFAHNGEAVLNELLPGGFKHNENSVRVLRRIEKQGEGLNLTLEVLDGILCHSGFSKASQKAMTLEGQVVKYSDKIAYVNHDIDDSIRAGILNEEDLPQKDILVLGKTHTKRIDTLVKDCIYTTINNMDKGIKEVTLSSEISESLSGLRNYMFKNIYNGEKLRIERDKAKFILNQVFFYYIKNPDKMPSFYLKIVEEEGLYRGVSDYIAGMSDDYCLLLFNDIFVPKFVIY